MIKKVNIPPNVLNDLSKSKVLALFNTYGDKTEMYVQETNGQITAFFGGFESGFSLSATKYADFQELDGFFSVLNAEVFCENDIADHLNPKAKTKCHIMRLENEINGTFFHNKISDIYNVLKMGSDGDIELPPFEFWYPDFCLRFNHNSAEYSLCEKAVAVCGFMTKDASLITGVAVEKDFRGQNFGKNAVAGLVTAIKTKYKNSKIYAASSDKNVPFYKKCGFVLDSEYAVLRYGSEQK